MLKRKIGCRDRITAKLGCGGVAFEINQISVRYGRGTEDEGSEYQSDKHF